ncbi:alpha/beta hydrolase [Diaminobutyricibacter tongyongensis]|uniref:Alpha/beta hydrolase n=1 Tax=Leifsonia tongyongensis TaxID=1268043 RepID=A0A6L9XU55_9MICO|nr:alpha/beta fold hydrolase [Diaminobutyricibacter tongyongensis]NEN04614.1 alpha/beta hydrolase [Diaminobutyricibacter tongyongensis]
MANISFTLASGRKVGVSTLGDADAERVVVFCHSAPGSSIFDPDPLVTNTRNVHILALDRPGYGSSDPLPAGEWPSIRRYADDIAEYLRFLRRDEGSIGVRPGPVGVAGWSAGGRVALALAARHPELVDRVAIVATPAPNEQVPWIPPELASMSEELGKRPPDVAISQLGEQLDGQLGDVLNARADAPVPLDAVGASETDSAVLELPGARDRLERMMRDALAQGTRGLAADILSYTARPWGFDVAAVKAKTLIVNGQADAIAGNAHATWYQRSLPDARVEMIPKRGHLVIIPAWDRVLSHVGPGTRLRR